jgi:chromosome segregation ATPase
MLIESMKQAEKEQHYSNLITEYEETLKESKEREEEVKMMRQQNKELEEQLIKEKHKNLQKMNILTKEKEETITQQNNLAEEKNKEIEQLKKDNELILNNLKESEEQIIQLQNKLEEQYNELQNTNKKLKEQLMTNTKQSDNKIMELERILKETQEELHVYKATSEISINNTETELKKAHVKILEYEQEISELQEKLMTANDELEKTKRSFSIKLESVIKQSEEEAQSRYKESIKRSKEQADEVIKSLELEITNLKAENRLGEVANDELERYKELLKAKELECESYASKVNETEENPNSLNSQLEFLDRENTKLRNEILNLRNDLQTTTEEHSMQLDKIKKQSETNAEVMLLNMSRMQILNIRKR